LCEPWFEPGNSWELRAPQGTLLVGPVCGNGCATPCALLMACACAPVQAHDINALFGFRLECLERLGEEFVYVWRRINELFNFLPLAASIEGKILCMHGGIGRSINKVCSRVMQQRGTRVPKIQPCPANRPVLCMCVSVPAHGATQA